jgi:2,4-dienoyl-CoA reductase-like NADH-dependent reductase (Old Yellow Enzyme family)/thioredoxin reductase
MPADWEARGREHYPHLFAPIQLSGVPLRNRIAHASMTTKHGRGQKATAPLINYHRSRAQGGAALIVTEPLSMLPWHTIDYKVSVTREECFDSLCEWAEAVEGAGARLLGQIQDSGRGRHERGRHPFALGPSALPDDLSWTVPHVMTADEVRRMIDDIVAGCVRLKEAGFSGAEISAGHGHLFHQFLSPWSNRREDEFGGSLANRIRLVKDMAAGIRSACGENFIIGLKLPGDDGVADSIGPTEAAEIANTLADPAVVSYFAFAMGSHAPSLWMHIPDMHGPRAPYMSLIAELKAACNGIPVMGLGLITDPAEADGFLAAGQSDFIGFGRPLVTDPGLPIKSALGREATIRYCVSCNTCWATIVEDHIPIECDNNPRVAKREELDWWPEPTDQPRRIVVVGAGVAGMEAAWVAGARGHEVTVLGAGADVGGKTRLRAELPGGENLSSIYDYQMLAAKRAGVAVELGFKAGLDDVLSLAPDAVVIATGSTMLWPHQLPEELHDEELIPDLRTLMTTLKDHPGKESGAAVIFDYDHTAGTYASAQLLKQIFDRVVIITPRERIAQDEPLVTRQVVYKLLMEQGIELMLLSEPVGSSILETGDLVVRNVYSGAEQVIDDLAVFTYATPRVPDDQLVAPLRAQGVETHVIGDAYAPRTVLSATKEGHAVGNRL